MSRARLGFAACALVGSSLLSSGAPARAQTAPAAKAAPTGGLSFDVGVLSKASAGAWADYSMSATAAPTAQGAPKSMTIRYSLVERTPKKMVLEIDTPTAKGDVIVHFELAPAGTDTWKLAGGRMMRGDEKADMTKEEVAAAPPMKSGAQPGQLVGTESVTVPGGTFSCKHFRNKLTADENSPVLDLWVSDTVAPTGLVKSVLSPAGITMQLAAVGVGAQAKLK